MKFQFKIWGEESPATAKLTSVLNRPIGNVEKVPPHAYAEIQYIVTT